MYLLAEAQVVTHLPKIPKMEIGGNLMIVLVIALMVLVRFFIAYMRHKQTMAAINKNIPLSELKQSTWKGLNWITSLTAGIALLIIAAGFACMQLASGNDYDRPPLSFLLIAVVLFAIGLAFFIRGLLLRKSQRQIQPSGQTEAADIKKNADISTLEN